MSYECPLTCSCTRSFATEQDLRRHWDWKHASHFGSIDEFRRRESMRHDARSMEPPLLLPPVADGAHGSCDDVVAMAMSHIDAMKFRFYKKDADVNRAKDFAHDVMQAVKPVLVSVLQPHVRTGTNVAELIDPVMSLLEAINTRRREATHRRKETGRVFQPLRVYPRKLGRRSLKRAQSGAEPCVSYAYDTRLEEIIEREFAVDPPLISEVVLAHKHWLRRSKEIRESDFRALDRTFHDICDGQAWQEHPHLGNPEYVGPTRLAFEGYCDEVDVPNPIGTAAGHHKLWISFIVILNRPPRSRMTLRSINLATICLAADFKTFGPRVLISDPGNGGLEHDASSCAIGPTMRRFDKGVVLKTPPAAGMTELPVRGWMPIWTADGLAQGEVYGTNASFSKAINICNRCEDMDQRDPSKRKPCSFLSCTCGDADEHKRGCPCHFRLRTAAREAARPPVTKAMMQSLGFTTLDHGFVDVPYFNIARPGPKETMHAFAEGRTAHLGAYTFWNIVKSGLATKDEIRVKVKEFDWTPGGGSSGFFSPTYLPDKIFVSTRVRKDGNQTVWGPHSEVKLPFSAHGMITFTIMSIPFFRQFFHGSELPSWFRAWVLHAHAFLMMLRYNFTFDDLLTLEQLLVKSEQLLLDIPEYSHIWTAKAHWILHLALDIYDWGVPPSCN